MNTIARAITQGHVLNVAMVALGAAFVPNAYAGCADLGWSADTFNTQMVASSLPAPRFARAAAVDLAQATPAGGDIVGMWAITLTAKNSPPFPDGFVVDAGFAQWHSDGTEITNSSRDPRTGNFCLGVWKKTGPSTYKLSHRGLSWDGGGNFQGPAVITQEVTVSQDGNSFSGAFTIDQFDTSGHVVIHIAGNVTAARITVE